MVWLPDGEIFLKIGLFFSTKYTNVTDKRENGRPDRWTQCDGIGHAYV